MNLNKGNLNWASVIIMAFVATHYCSSLFAADPSTKRPFVIPPNMPKAASSGPPLIGFSPESRLPIGRLCLIVGFLLLGSGVLISVVSSFRKSWIKKQTDPEKSSRGKRKRKPWVTTITEEKNRETLRSNIESLSPIENITADQSNAITAVFNSITIPVTNSRTTGEPTEDLVNSEVIDALAHTLVSEVAVDMRDGVAFAKMSIDAHLIFVEDEEPTKLE